MTRPANDGFFTQASVLFLDVRNSTLFIDNYDEVVVAELLDSLFNRSREVVQDTDGTVDKLIGDGLMAVFQGESHGECVIEAAARIYDKAVPKTEREDENFRAIDIGIGIATGDVLQTTVADIDQTVVGRPVNIAARLQGLCKDYNLSILIDEKTHEQLGRDSLPGRFAIRRIPDQSLRGIQQNVNTYNICDTERLNETYVETFNRGVNSLTNHNYDRALSEFTEAYSRHERYTDGTLLNHFTNRCLEKLHGSQELFTNPDQYEEHSTTQQQQSYKLQMHIRQEMERLDINPYWVLDVGCGTGNVTERICKELFPESRLVGIDPSSRAIAKAKAEHSPDDLDITYNEGRIEQYCPEEERDRYDIIFSNSAMHWVEEQDHAYNHLRQLVAEDGFLAVHQGGKKSYQELHDVAVKLIDRFNYRHYFDELDVPLDLTYYDREEMRALLKRSGFEIASTFQLVEANAPETIIDDFAEASLNAYCQRLDNKSQREVFRQQFKKEAKKQHDPSDITVNRIYLTAVPQAR